MTDEEIFNEFHSLWNDILHGETFPQKRPLLAHYTSISNLELILRNDEVWFANPLYMNDIEELKFGMEQGARAFRDSKAIKDAFSSSNDYELLRRIFDSFFEDYASNHVFDTYIFSLSEHKPDNKDGLLSMWRGYGGDGSGAALVIDSEKIVHVEATPLIISKVIYAPNSKRIGWIENKMVEFADLIRKNPVSPNQLHIAVQQLFERIKMFALFSKHDGFSEESEWRIAFLSERDRERKFSSMLGYSVNQYGIEPRLKFKVAPIEGYTSKDLCLEKLVSQIILGPRMSSPLAVTAFQRMLKSVGKSSLVDRVIASSTPYRSRHI